MTRVVGIGLVVLDIVLDGQSAEPLGTWAGGSCGNVMAILSWLGWDAAPVARLDDGDHAKAVRHDLDRWGVDTRWLALGESAPAPVFVERLSRKPDGTISHRFERKCPACGGRLPPYRAVTLGALSPVVADLSEWDVLYVDRPSAGAIALASAAREQGLLVLFEPSARGTPRHLAALAATADIVKYSADRLTTEDRAVIAAAAPPLEIETLGAAGLRFRRRGAWAALSAPRVKAHDSAGAGDWTTAGLLHYLSATSAPLERLTEDALLESLSFAQGMGAWSCRFAGARGAMERHGARQALDAAAALVAGESHAARVRRSVPRGTVRAWACHVCR